MVRSDSDRGAGRNPADAELARAAFAEYRRTRAPQALARVFDLTAQELLLVAHHLARRGVSAEDLVQETFLEALGVVNAYDESRPLLPWLCGILVNVARRRNREQGREYEAWRLNNRLSEDPAELAGAQEFAQALREAIAEFPSPQRDVLTLRLVHGLTPTEIAHALGHPPGSVKSWVHRGIERLRYALPPAFGAALASFASAAPSLAEQREQLLTKASELLEPAAPSAVDGVRGSATRSWGAWSALFVAGVSIWMLWLVVSGDSPTPSAASEASKVGGLDPGATPATSLRAEASDGSELDAARASGELEIVASYASDGAPAELALRLTPRWGPDPSFRAIELRTDARGVARVGGLAHGEWELRADRCEASVFELGAGGARVLVSVPAGALVRGRAVDEHGAGIGGARVWLSSARSLNDGQFVATTAADGSFELRDAPPSRAVALHAAGFAPSAVRLVSRFGAEPASFKLLRERRELRGRVVATDGAPLPGARLLVGTVFDESMFGFLSEGHSVVAPLTLVCDEQGEFAGDWLPAPWSASLRVRAPGFASVEYAGPFDGPLRIELDAGVIWRGTLGAPAPGHDISVLTADSIAAPKQLPDWLAPRWLGRGATSFEVPGVGAGVRVLSAVDGARRTCSTLAPAPLNGAIVWSPDCARPVTLRGVVRGDDGAPLAGAQIEALRLGAAALRTTSDASGEFEFEDLGGVGVTLITRAAPGGCVIDRRVDVRDLEQRLEIVVARERRATAFVVLGVRDSEGRELNRLAAFQSGHYVPAHVERLPDGRLRLGPIPAGRYFLSLAGESAESLHVGPFDLAPFAELDAGDYVSQPPGQLEVVVTGLPPADRGAVHALLVGRESGAMLTVFKLTDGRGTCLPTTPGPCLVRLMFPHSGLFEAPVAVTPGALTRVELAAPRGAAVCFTLRDEALDDALVLRGRIENLDSGELFELPLDPRRTFSDGARRLTRNLGPGRYRIELDDRFALRGSAVFAVGSGAERIDVAVELR